MTGSGSLDLCSVCGHAAHLDPICQPCVRAGRENYCSGGLPRFIRAEECPTPGPRHAIGVWRLGSFYFWLCVTCARTHSQTMLPLENQMDARAR